jgi:ABC-type transport system involved in multi-copper enzyme maturation permease subunit
MNVRAIGVIARFVVLEALRGGLPWLALACVAASAGLAAFLAHVALTETRELQATVCAAVLRGCAAFLIATHVVASMAREASDRGLELALTLPISRSTYYAGKLAGFACCGTMLATAFALPLLAWSAPASVLQWWMSLTMETVLVAATSLFFATTLPGIVPAIAATAGLYLLGRSLSTIRAIVAGPLADGPESPLRGAVETFALLFPRLDWGPRTEWLVYGSPGANEFLATWAGYAIYLALLAAAGLFDFNRRDL